MHGLSYHSIRLLGFPLSLLSYPQLHRVGRVMGKICYYLLTNFRKKVYSNLSIASSLNLNEQQKRKIAIESFENLAITCLEFFRLKKRRKELTDMVIYENPDEIEAMVANKQGVIFFSGHESNWEIPFIEFTRRYPGTAIGRPTKNRLLYQWILSVREMYQAKIITPKNALTEGLKELKQGRFIGIVGDQALPESSYSYPFLGVRAWTSTAPALLAYKTGCPIVVCTTRRIDHKYYLRYSTPFWPDLTKPLKQEVIRLMDVSMAHLEKSVKNNPGQWLWQHDRWKQSGIDHVKKKYRYAFILTIFPNDPAEFEKHQGLFSELKTIYPRSFLKALVPSFFTEQVEGWELIPYNSKKDLYLKEGCHQLVLDFYGSQSVRRHFRKQGAFVTLNNRNLMGEAKKKSSLEDLLTVNDIVHKALCKPK